jgi:hypothetical protein
VIISSDPIILYYYVYSTLMHHSLQSVHYSGVDEDAHEIDEDAHERTHSSMK